MKINEIIKTKRLELNLTQEQVAKRLGITTPAVNKWERGLSYPDITLLPPLARLLHIDLNTLLSFQEDLSKHEIGMMINELFETFSKENYEETFNLVTDKIREYPNCELLILNCAMSLQGGLYLFDIENKEMYEIEIQQLLSRCVESKDLEIKNLALTTIIGKCIEIEDLDRAQTYVDMLPNNGFERISKQGTIFRKTGKIDEAAKLYEERIFQDVTKITTLLNHLMELSIDQGHMEDAEELAGIISQTSSLYSMWDWNAYLPYYLLYTKQKKEDKCIETLDTMLDLLSQNYRLPESVLYRHIEKKTMTGNGLMFEHMLNSLQDDKTEELDFIRNNSEFKALILKYKKSTH